MRTQLVAKINLGCHIFQAVWSIVVMGVVIASMVAPGSASSPARFMFALCWINVPGLIYLIMCPRFNRTRNFAHPYWLCGINIIYLIFWFSAFVALAAYNNKGMKEGMEKEKDEKLRKEGGCAVFKAGTGEDPKACEMNKSAVGLGVVMWFFWLLTALVAIYGAWYFKRNSISPFEDLTTPSHDIQETTKDAFSSNDEYSLINKQSHVQHDDAYDDYDMDSSQVGQSTIGHSQLGHSQLGHMRSESAASSRYGGAHSAYSEDAHPGRPLSWAADREPYAGIGGHAPIAPPHGELSMPDVPDDYSYRGAGGRY